MAPSLGVDLDARRARGLARQAARRRTATRVLRAGYAMAYNRPGMSDFTGVFGDESRRLARRQPRAPRSANLNDGRGLPVLLRDARGSARRRFPTTQQYPLTDVITGDLNIFDPNLQVPYSQTWTGGIGRKLTRDIGLEVRYVGTRHLQAWANYNYNETNIIENGFLDEFRGAGEPAGEHRGRPRQHVRLHRRRPGTVAAADLPRLLQRARRRRRRATRRTTPADAAGPNTNFTNPLACYNPSPFTPAGTNANTGLDGDPARRANALARRPAGELLPRQSRSAGRRDRHRQRRLHALRRAAARSCASGCRTASCSRPATSSARPTTTQRYSLRSRPVRHAADRRRRRRRPRVQGELGLRAAVRPRAPVPGEQPRPGSSA